MEINFVILYYNQNSNFLNNSCFFYLFSNYLKKNHIFALKLIKS